MGDLRYFGVSYDFKVIRKSLIPSGTLSLDHNWVKNSRQGFGVSSWVLA